MLQSLPWIHPLDLARALDEQTYVLLYSGVQTSYSGRYSYLACDLAEKLQADHFGALASRLSRDKGLFENAWFGYLGYGLKNSLEPCGKDKPGWLGLPDLCMMRFNRIYQFDHLTQQLAVWSVSAISEPRLINHRTQPVIPPVAELGSNMTRQAYLAKVAGLIERIHSGELYQANLTRKFIGQFASAPDYFSIFKRLCGIAPAPYSAFLRLGDVAIASSSPELFLHVDANGTTRTRPIKGTAPRFADAAEDQRSRDALERSAKDRAENLMIVDLMRNDLAKTSIPGSVHAKQLFELTSHATIHHLSSTITSRLAEKNSCLDAVMHCFPPGSMTGAPKIAAMDACSQLELDARGVYAGAIGWFGGDGSCELSVVIRTLLVKDRRFEFQVGGGIVADSVPEQELAETLEKAKGIIQTIGISRNDLWAL